MSGYGPPKHVENFRIFVYKKEIICNLLRRLGIFAIHFFRGGGHSLSSVKLFWGHRRIVLEYFDDKVTNTVWKGTMRDRRCYGYDR